MTRMAPIRRQNQRGFALVMAIFVVVVLAMLGIFMVTIGSVSRSTATAAVQGARAYFAARSGIEWGIFQAMPPTNSCAASSTITLTKPGLNGFNVNVQCVQTPPATQHKEYGTTYSVYVITATATSGAFGAPGYVSRTIQATVTNALAP